VLATRNKTLTPLKANRVTSRIADWCDLSCLNELVNDIDIIVHAAGADAVRCQNTPLFGFESNAHATAKLASVAARAKVKKFIYLSTAHVYDAPLSGVITEKSITRNRHPYATSHLAGEAALLGEAYQSEMSPLILRLSNIFGPPGLSWGGCWALVVNDLCKQAIVDGKMILVGDGSEQRDFLSISDFCEIIFHCLSYDFGNQTDPIFNVGTGVSRTVLSMAEKIREIASKLCIVEPEIILGAPKNDVSASLHFCVEKLKKEIVFTMTDPATEIERLAKFCAAEFGVS
jgi:UDP-glucose 4-epimerase